MIFASTVSLLNAELMTSGRQPLGFLNTWFYSTKVRESLLDITSGQNTGCSSGGFPAVEGWDAVTGLGMARDYQRLRASLGLS